MAVLSERDNMRAFSLVKGSHAAAPAGARRERAKLDMVSKIAGLRTLHIVMKRGRIVVTFSRLQRPYDSAGADWLDVG